MSSQDSFGELLCLRCGMCCNGVLFKDVELQPGDDARHLAALGLPVRVTRSAKPKEKCAQPCAVLEADNCCRIYADRPVRCRQFECVQLKSVRAGEIDLNTAQRTIERARQRVDSVRTLLRRLGDGNEGLPLSVRFNRLKRRLERDCRDERAAEDFARLTFAMHELNLLLSTAFYPAPGD